MPVRLPAGLLEISAISLSSRNHLRLISRRFQSAAVSPDIVYAYILDTFFAYTQITL